MSTQPIPDLLFIPSAEERNDFRAFSGLVQEVVNFGTHVLTWHADSRELGEVDLVAVVHFRHGLDVLFAISALIGNGIADPTKALIRVLMETTLALKYLLQQDSEQRALCYIFCHYQRELAILQKVTPDTQAAAQFQDKIRRDLLLNQLPLPEYADVQKQEESVLRGLALPKYAAIDAEYQRLRATGNRNPAWHAFFGGPSSIEQVADRVGDTASYEVLYRYFSGIIHGTSILKGSVSAGGITQLRSPKDLPQVVKHTVNWGSMLIDTLVEPLMPACEPEVNAWYNREIRQRLLAL